MGTSEEVARWMLDELERVKILEQETAVYEIETRFGTEHIYTKDNGNSAISKAVLAEFNKLSGENVVWDRTERYWRFRSTGDDPGRSQT